MFWQREARRAAVFVEWFGRGGADDQTRDPAVAQTPGQRHLAQGHVQLVCKGDQGFDLVEFFGREIAPHEAAARGIGGAEGAGRESRSGRRIRFVGKSGPARRW